MVLRAAEILGFARDGISNAVSNARALREVT
jgi:hypothetical protein